MIGLRTARALVIDDDADEAIPLITALGRLGIGAVYLPGDKAEELPAEPFRGIRLAFVDMKLNIEGSPKQVVGKTVNVLRRVLTQEESPCIIVVWTKHPSYLDEFKDMLGTALPKLQPGVVWQMEKPTKFDIAKITGEISANLADLWPLGVLLAWEQMAHDAATGATETISTVVAGEASGANGGTVVQRWQRSVKSVLAALFRAGGGQIVDRNRAIRTLLEGLNALHLDHLENEEREICDSNANKLLWDNVGNLSNTGKVDLNTRLLTSAVDDDDMRVRPGNLYLPSPTQKAKCPVTRFRLGARDIIRDMAPKWTKNDAYNSLSKTLKKLEKAAGDEVEIKSKKKELEEQKLAIVSECLPILLEISPACDFAQGKQHVARLIGGLLVPDKHRKVFAIDPAWRTYLKQLQGISIAGRDGIWHPVLDARFCYGIRNPGRAIRVKPSCRFRVPVVVDVQSWFAAHAARPGYAVVD